MINDGDLRIDVYRANRDEILAGRRYGDHLRITHLPTGTVVMGQLEYDADGGLFELKMALLNELREKLRTISDSPS